MINPVNLNIVNNQYNKQNSQNGVLKPSFADTGNVKLSNYEVGQAILNRNNISFLSQSSILKINPCCTLVLTDKQCNPTMHIDIVSNKNIPIKQGLFAVYSMALNDQIYEQNTNSNGVVTSHLICKPNRKKLDFEVRQDNFLDSIKMINDSFFQAKIDEKHINTAKKLAPVLLFLSRKTNEYQDEMFDIPLSMSEKEYESLLASISYKDLIEYNDNLLKNSQLKMEISMNKEYYKHHSDILTKYFNTWNNNNEY